MNNMKNMNDPGDTSNESSYSFYSFRGRACHRAWNSIPMPGPGAVFNLVPPLAPALRGGGLLSFHFNMNGGFVSSEDTVVIE